MAVRVLEVHATAAIPVVELAVLQAPRCAAIGETRIAYPAKDGVEGGVVEVEGIVMTFEIRLLTEQQRERLIDAYRREMPRRPIEAQAEDAREKPRGSVLVTRRHDGVVQRNGHI